MNAPPILQVSLLVRKLERFASLAAEDITALQEMAGRDILHLAARRDLICEGEKPRHVNLLLSGWAYRYKTLEDGRRQIIAFFLPGDLCDLHIFLLREMDHSIAALTPIEFASIAPQSIDALTVKHPRIAQAFWWESLVDMAIQREWTVNLGRRSALERLAHLFCELFTRLGIVGMTRGDSYELPITQSELADAMGMTPVHINRTLQDMRAQDLVRLKGRLLTIPDFGRLRDVALFDPHYLHLQRCSPDEAQNSVRTRYDEGTSGWLPG